MTSRPRTFQPDRTDLALLRLLESDARLPVVTLAKRLGISRTTVQVRIDKLLANGVIGGFTVKPGSTYPAGKVHGHLMITIAPKMARQIETRLKALAQIRSLYSVSGAFDLIAVVAAESVDEMDATIDEIGLIEGVERTTSSIILSTRLSR